MANPIKFAIVAALLATTSPLHAQDNGTQDEAPTAGTSAQEEDAAPGGVSPSGAPDAENGAPAAQPEPGGDPAGVDQLSMGQEIGGEGEAQIGATYVAETHGDWEQRCVRTETGKDPCQLYQLLRDEQDNSVAEISIFGLPEGQQAAAGATIITPLETLLTQQLTLAVDGSNSRRYPFTFCAQNGCFARIGFTADDIAAFKRGKQATLTIVPAAAPDQKIPLTISLNGFTAGYDATNAANVENQQQ